jgi:F-type H+-transporting ATPase subunit a
MERAGLMAVDGKIFDVMSQFKLNDVGLTFTNSNVWMAGAAVGITLLMTWGMRARARVPGRMQNLAESAYTFVHGIVDEQIGHEGRKFFPFVFTLFMFILFGNMLGMLPYGFTFTSHIAVTFALAAVVFTLTTVVAIMIHGSRFFSYFVPQGAPKVLLPLIVPIEIISYLSRLVSLSVRLFANMMAGHVMLKVFAGFIVMLGTAGGLGYVGAVAPLAINVALIGFEFLVAFLQAYVFAILTSIYLHDAVHLH